MPKRRDSYYFTSMIAVSVVQVYGIVFGVGIVQFHSRGIVYFILRLVDIGLRVSRALRRRWSSYSSTAWSSCS